MVKLVVTVSLSGQAYVYAAGAGYTASTCSTATLTEASVYAAWNGRSIVNVATCDSCSGYGVRSLVYTITGVLLDGLFVLVCGRIYRFVFFDF